MQDYSDERLITDYLKGDEKSLEILIKRYLKPIYSFVYRHMGNFEEAENITQEVFVRVWRNLKKSPLSLSKGFNPKKGNFKTWIFSIARNASIDWLKKKKTIPFSKFDTDDGNILVNTLIDSAPSPQELLEKVNIAQILAPAMEKLPPEYRKVLFLRYNDDFTFQEIAKIFGESLNTIKSRHRRALAQLKKFLTF